MVKKQKRKILIISAVIILITTIILLGYNKFKNSEPEKIYDNIDNYSKVSIPYDIIKINGLTFSNFRYQTSKDAPNAYFKVKNETDSDITEERKYQITFWSESPEEVSNEIFYITDLKAGEETEITIALTNIMKKIIGFHIDEF